MPDFLDLPPRPPKPRERGVTHVIDTGLSHAEADGLMASAADYIDLVRLGWGSAYVTRDLRAKLDALPRRGRAGDARRHADRARLAARPRSTALRDWLRRARASSTSRSRAARSRSRADEKLELIERLAADFTVFAEVGEKDPAALLAPYRWVELIRDALEAGPTQVICEGRATGDAGMYRPGRRGAHRPDRRDRPRGRRRAADLRGAAEAPAGLVHPAFRSRRQPRQRAARAT